MNCKYCGQPLSANDKFCPSCGKQVEAQSHPHSQASNGFQGIIPPSQQANSSSQPGHVFPTAQKKRSKIGWKIVLAILAVAIVSAGSVFVLSYFDVIRVSALSNLLVSMGWKDSGDSAGTDLKWSLDGGTLTIIGSGTMYDWNSVNNVPWHEKRDEIYRVSLGSGVRSVGRHAFGGCTNLHTVVLPNTVTNINSGSFDGCDGIEDIYYGGDEDQWEKVEIEEDSGFSPEIEPVVNVQTEETDIFPLYIEAAEKTTETGSWQETMSLTANVTAADGGNSSSAATEMGYTINIDGYQKEDLSKLSMTGNVNMTIDGQDYAQYSIFYSNGTAQYRYTKPREASYEAITDPDFFRLDAITEEMVSFSVQYGDILRFTIRGADAELLGAWKLDSVEDCRYGDIDVQAKIQKDTGKLKTLMMDFDVSFTYQGQSAEAEYAVTYNFSDWTKPEVEYVTDAYNETMEYDGSTLSYRIPQINLDFDNIEDLNKEIYDHLYYGDDGKGGIQRELNSISDGCSVVLFNTDYDWATNGDTLSLWTTAKTYWGITNYTVYNRSTTSGEEVLLDELLKAHGWDETTYRDKVKHAMGSCFWDTYAEAFKSNSKSPQFIEEMDRQMQKTISEENISAARPYLDENGELCIAAYIYSMAGADCYQRLLNLDTFVPNPNYTESISVSDASAFVGHWELDPQKTYDEIGKALLNIFGSSIKYGSRMDIDEDTTFSYYIAAGNGGEGSWRIEDGNLLYEIETYETGKKETKTLVLDTSESEPYLIMDYYGDRLYWRRE